MRSFQVFALLLNLSITTGPQLATAQFTDRPPQYWRVAFNPRNYSQSGEIWHQVIELNPSKTQAFYNLAMALRERGQLDAAIVALLQAIRLKPNYAEAYNSLGVVLGEQGQLDAAIINLRRAIQLDPSNAIAYSNLALV